MTSSSKGRHCEEESEADLYCSAEIERRSLRLRALERSWCMCVYVCVYVCMYVCMYEFGVVVRNGETVVEA